MLVQRLNTTVAETVGEVDAPSVALTPTTPKDAVARAAELGFLVLNCPLRDVVHDIAVALGLG